MLINNKEADSRLNSPNNLLNKLRNGSLNNNKRSAMNLFGIGVKKEILEGKNNNNPFSGAIATVSKTMIPEIITGVVTDDKGAVLDSILDNAESKIKMEIVHNEALDTLVSAIRETKAGLIGVSAPKAADVAAKMSKIVDSIRSERNKSGNTKAVHLHFYTPEQKKLEEYETVNV